MWIDLLYRRLGDVPHEPLVRAAACRERNRSTDPLRDAGRQKPPASPSVRRGAAQGIDVGEPVVAQRRTFVTWRAHSSLTSPTLCAKSATAESTNGGLRERRSVRGDQAVGPLG